MFVLAWIVRVVTLAALGDVDPIPATTDMRTYYEQALGLGLGTWPPAAAFYYHPLMPYLARLSFLLFDTSPLAPRLLNTLVSAANCALAAAWAGSLASRRTGLLCGLLLAVHQASVYYATVILDVPLTSCAVTALAWLATQPSTSRATWVGALGGVAVLGRGALLLTIVAVLAILLVRKAYKPALVCAATAALFVAPVLVRNAHYGCLCLTRNGSVNLWIGNNPRAPGWYSFALGPDDPPVTSPVWFERVVTFIVEQPGRWLELMLYKAKLFLLVPDGMVPEQANVMEGVVRFSWLAHLPGTLSLSAVALLGLYLARKEHKPWGAIYVVWASCFASVVLFFFETRFRVPVVTLYALLSAHALDRGLCWAGQRVASVRAGRSTP